MNIISYRKGTGSTQAPNKDSPFTPGLLQGVLWFREVIDTLITVEKAGLVTFLVEIVRSLN